MILKFRVGDEVQWRDCTGEIILINVNIPQAPYKVMFDDPDGPNYDYYPENELKLIPFDLRKRRRK